MALTIAAVAAAKDIHPQQIEVQVQRTTVEGAAWQTTFAASIDLGAGLSRRERVILYNSARHCEVHKLLSGEMSLDIRLV